MVPPREAADQDVQEDSSAAVRLQDAIDTDSLLPSYWAHRVVRAATSPVMPYGLYLDGVHYSQTDSVLGVWLFNRITGARLLITLMRSKGACACGCKGWCSYYGLMQCLHWSMSALASGTHPASRHDMGCMARAP
jgi:hypothetical protein